MRCFTLVFFDDQNMEKLPLSYSLRAEEGTMSCWYAFSSSLPASLCLCITSLFLSFPIAFTHSLCFTVLLVRSPMYLWSTGIYFFYKRTRASSRPAFRTHAVKRRWKLKTINCRLNCVTSCHGVSLQHRLYVHMFTYIFKGHQPHLTCVLLFPPKRSNYFVHIEFTSIYSWYWGEDMHERATNASWFSRHATPSSGLL